MAPSEARVYGHAGSSTTIPKSCPGTAPGRRQQEPEGGGDAGGRWADDTGRFDY